MSVWRCLRTSRNEGKSSDLINQEGWNQPRNFRANRPGAPRRKPTGNAQLCACANKFHSEALDTHAYGDFADVLGTDKSTFVFRVAGVLKPSACRCRRLLRRLLLDIACGDSQNPRDFSRSRASALQWTCFKALEAGYFASVRTASWHFDV